MKRTIRWAIVLLVGGAMNLQAALIDVNGDDMKDGTAGSIAISGTDQTGTVSASVSYTDGGLGDTNVDAIRTKAYTVNGIDFDGDSLEDVLTWTYHTDGLMRCNAENEGTTFSISVAGSIANSRAGYTSTVVFNGFDEFRANLGGDEYILGTTGIGSSDIASGLTANYTFATPVQQFTQTRVAGTYQLTDVSYSFNVTTIPEPATLSLIGVFGIGLLAARRRFMI